MDGADEDEGEEREGKKGCSGEGEGDKKDKSGKSTELQVMNGKVGKEKTTASEQNSKPRPSHVATKVYIYCSSVFSCYDPLSSHTHTYTHVRSFSNLEGLGGVHSASIPVQCCHWSAHILWQPLESQSHSHV